MQDPQLATTAMTIQNEKLKEAIHKIMQLLVGGKYKDVEQLTQGQRLASAEMKAAISQYGRTLCVPGGYEDASIFPFAVETERRGQCAFRFTQLKKGDPI